MVVWDEAMRSRWTAFSLVVTMVNCLMSSTELSSDPFAKCWQRKHLRGRITATLVSEQALSHKPELRDEADVMS